MSVSFKCPYLSASMPLHLPLPSTLIPFLWTNCSNDLMGASEIQSEMGIVKERRDQADRSFWCLVQMIKPEFISVTRYNRLPLKVEATGNNRRTSMKVVKEGHETKYRSDFYLHWHQASVLAILNAGTILHYPGQLK